MMKSMLPTAALVIATLVGTNMARAAEATTKVDLTPLLSGVEKDCASANRKFDTVIAWLTTQTGKAPVVAKAGPELRAAIGKAPIKVKDDGDSWTLSMPLPNASYRGAALVGMDRWIGKDNGVNGFSLLFADSPAAVTKAIGKIRPAKANEEAIVPQLFGEKGTSRTVLMCDFST